MVVPAPPADAGGYLWMIKRRAMGFMKSMW
jgi:hypothetical protein